MYLFSTLFVCSLISCLHGQVIDEHPLPLLIPINETAVFSCRAHCINKTACTGIHWVINNTPLGSEEKRSMSGFIFSVYKKNGYEYVTILTVNATEAINNTEVYCVFEESGAEGGSNHSRNATLLVITESPISANPSIKKNSTHLSLLWSPPFLWPGQRIDYYNISFVNKSDGSITYDRVNSTFSDQVVKFAKKIHQNEMCTSTEIEFGISAVNVSGYLLPTINISDWISPSPYIDIQSNWSAAITTSLLKNDISVLIVDFKLPTLKCASLRQELYYTLMVYNERGELISQFGPVEYCMQGSKNVRQTIDSPNIEESQSYSLTVQVDIYAQTVTSCKYNFGTFYPEMDQTMYAAPTQCHTATCIALTTETDSEAPEVRTTINDFISSFKIVFGICFGIITILLLVLMILIFCVAHLCSHRFKRRAYIATDRRSKDTKARACNNMVHNPIYAGLSGSVYDSIWPLAESFDENHMPTTANHRPNATTTTTTTTTTTAATNTTGKTALRGTSDEYQPSTARHKDSLLW